MTPYVYPARVIRVIDADSLEIELDRGWHDWSQRRLRLLRVDAPEVRGPQRPQGLAATAFVLDWVREASEVEDTWPFDVWSVELDSFGRILGELRRRLDGASLNDALIAQGWIAT